MPKQAKNTNNKRSSKDLQIEILKFLLTHSKKRFAPRQLIELLKLENNADSVEHALDQLASIGTVRQLPGNKYAIALERFTVEEDEYGDADASPESTAVAPQPVEKGRQQGPERRRRDRQDGAPTPGHDNAPWRGGDEERPAHEEKLQKKGHRGQTDKGREARKPQYIDGRVDMTRTGSAYIVTDSLESDVYVAPKHINGALHGDTVRVLLFPAPPKFTQRNRKGARPPAQRRPEGEVVEILKRANEFFIGTLRKSRKYALVLPDNQNMPVDVYVPLEACGDARDGDKVVVRITDWQDGKDRVPVGKVTQTLGNVGGNDYEMNKILINAGFELTHTEAAQREADHIPETIHPHEYERRRDFRGILTFTIDPEDARDFDDALSVKHLDDGHIEIGVHIADVTHYLKPETALDREAYRRSTSVYLVDRVSPMLPEKLSNNLCSLVPHQDRLTFSAVFTFDKKDKLVKRWFGKTVIYSDHRFSYEEAQKVLEGQPSDLVLRHDRRDDLTKALQVLDRLAKKMRKERERQGAIGFETDEVRFRLAPDGTPIEAYVKERKDAHLLIEDFMLLANKEVAWYIDQKAQGQQEIPFVYRIHDLPDLAKVAEFARFALEMGQKINVSTPQQIAQSYNELMRAAKTDERLKLLEPLAIRTMAKAVYSTNNIGHYGLGFSHYAHFTSPIRRYSDVLAHRILELNLERTVRLDKEKLEDMCKHISQMERKAADAERESIKFKQAELVRNHIGDVFEGVISGFLDRGFFVELPGSRAEGLVDFRTLQDQYTVAEGNLRAHGKRYGRVFKMGDRVEVRVVAVDLARRQIELELQEE